MQPLSKTRPGDICTIKWMFGEPETLKTIRNMNIAEGSTIRVIQKLKDSLIIASGERRVALGGEAAARIQV